MERFKLLDMTTKMFVIKKVQLIICTIISLHLSRETGQGGEKADKQTLTQPIFLLKVHQLGRFDTAVTSISIME